MSNYYRRRDQPHVFSLIMITMSALLTISSSLHGNDENNALLEQDDHISVLSIQNEEFEGVIQPVPKSSGALAWMAFQSSAVPNCIVGPTFFAMLNRYDPGLSAKIVNALGKKTLMFLPGIGIFGLSTVFAGLALAKHACCDGCCCIKDLEVSQGEDFNTNTDIAWGLDNNLQVRFSQESWSILVCGSFLLQTLQAIMNVYDEESRAAHLLNALYSDSLFTSLGIIISAKLTKELVCLGVQACRKAPELAYETFDWLSAQCSFMWQYGENKQD